MKNKLRNLLVLLSALVFLFAFTACDDDDDDNTFDRTATDDDYAIAEVLVKAFYEAYENGYTTEYVESTTETEYRLSAAYTYTDDSYTINLAAYSDYERTTYTSGSVKYEWEILAQVTAADDTSSTVYDVDVQAVYNADGSIKSAELEINHKDIEITKGNIDSIVSAYII